MALIGNRSVLLKSPGRFLSGTVASIERNNFGLQRNRFESMSRLSGVPDGHLSPSSWFLPQVAGGMSSRNAIIGTGAASITMASGVNGSATLTGSGSLSGVGQLIISMAAALSGSGTVSNASAVAFLQLAATLAGEGDLAGAATAIGHAAAALSGSGDVTSTIRATGALAADITVSGDVLTSTTVGPAVWRTIIEAGYTAEQILRIIAAQAAGAATGLEGTNPQFTGLDGTTIRIDGTYSGGTRSIDNLDGS